MPEPETMAALERVGQSSDLPERTLQFREGRVVFSTRAIGCQFCFAFFNVP